MARKKNKEQNTERQKNECVFAHIYNDKNLFYALTPKLNLLEPVLRCIDGDYYDDVDTFIAGEPQLMF